MQIIYQIIKKTALCITLTIFAVSITTCTNQNADDREGENTVASQTVEQVLKAHTNELMSISGVVGTAQGLCDGQPCIKVLVIKKTSEIEEKIPETLDGYPVEIESTGEIKALPKNQD